ncbi:TPA: DUF3942 family protein [Bacillus thuringiensis]|uniref:DUF3942 family protein n=1 Tax=Bacillus sp. CH_70 TaxID=2978215 RepID=UPI0030F7104B|nr:DUF3942 family protein [Bacillus thuringiensis]
MSFQDQLATAMKKYLGEDLDETIIKDGYETDIFNYLVQLKKKVGAVQNESYDFSLSWTESKCTIEDVTLEVKIKTENNTIVIEKIVDGEVSSLDAIIVQDGELFAVGRNEKFTTQVFEEYLRETFGEKLGL